MAPSLEADLQPHDWLLAGTWSYVDRDPAEYTDFPQGPRADCIRYLPDGGELRLAWTPRADGSMHLHAYRLPDTTVTVERGRGRTWLVTTHGGGGAAVPPRRLLRRGRVGAGRPEGRHALFTLRGLPRGARGHGSRWSGQRAMSASRGRRRRGPPPRPVCVADDEFVPVGADARDTGTTDAPGVWHALTGPPSKSWSLYDLITKRSSDILTDPTLRDAPVDLSAARLAA